MSYTDIVFTLSMLCLLGIAMYGTYKNNQSIERGGSIIFVKDMTAIRLLSKVMGQNCEHIIIHEEEVTLSAYTACEEECDETPEVTANGTPSRIGLVAVSRDFISKGILTFGQRIIIPEMGIFEVADTMNERYENCIDILHANKKAALLFGRREHQKILWLETI